jgi:single-strand DNA-binding protein
MTVNKVILLGNVAQDPQIRTTQNGKKMATFSLATSDKWKDKQSGERQNKIEWHKVVVYNESLANIVEKYIFKGSRLYIEGSLQTRKWTDNNGVDKYITEIILQGYGCTLQIIDSKNNQSDNVESQVGNKPSGIEDEIPF